MESPYVQAQLTQLIKDWQPEFLRQLLGNEQYKAFETWYGDGTSPDQENPFYKLLNGGEYGEYQYCPGIKEPLTAFVYYYYKRDNATQSVSSGEVKTESQNSRLAESGDKMATAWNRMVNLVKENINYLVESGLESWQNYYQHNLLWPNRQRKIVNIVHPINARFN